MKGQQMEPFSHQFPEENEDSGGQQERGVTLKRAPLEWETEIGTRNERKFRTSQIANSERAIFFFETGEPLKMQLYAISHTSKIFVSEV